MSIRLNTLFGEFEAIENDCKELEKVSIAMDYLKLYGQIDLDLIQVPEVMDATNLPVLHFETMTLANKGQRTQWYAHLWEVILDGEVVGMLETHPNKLFGGFKADNASFKIHNHMLYCEYWPEVIEALQTECSFNILNVTRLDIAMDGLNPLVEFLNAYQRQRPNAVAVDRMGKMAKFDSLDFDDRNKSYSRFIVGSSSSGKQVSIYNKTNELENSNKIYIKRFWEGQGMDTTVPAIYRTEFRFDSKNLKNMMVSLECLIDPKYLASICLTASNKFFEWRWKTSDQNITRRPKVYLIPFDRMGATLLSKTRKPETGNRYKAKMSIHLVEKSIFLGKTKSELIESEKEHVGDLLGRFHLEEWHAKRLPQWHKECERLIRKDPQKLLNF